MHMKKLRILIVHNAYKIPGGEDAVVANELNLLRSAGHEVFLYQKDNAGLDSYSFFQKLFLPFRTIYSRKTYREVRALIRQHQIDLVHVHNTLLVISPSVYDAARSLGVPVVQTIHNFRLLCPNALRDTRPYAVSKTRLLPTLESTVPDRKPDARHSQTARHLRAAFLYLSDRI